MDDKTLIQSPPEPDPRSGNNEGSDKTIMQPGFAQDNNKTLFQPNALPPQQGYENNDKTLFAAPPPPSGDKTLLQSNPDATSVWGDRNNDNIPDFITSAPPPAQSIPAKKKDWTTTVLVVGGIAFILCICCMLGVAGYMIASDPNALSFMATATPTLAPEPTAKPTKVPPPTKAPTLAIEPTRPAFTITDNANFVEEFSNNNNEWSEGNFSDDYGDANFEFTGDLLRWTVTADKPVNQKDWAVEAPYVTDFTLSVDAQKTSGAIDSSFGLIFRVMDSNNLYYFGIADHSDHQQYYAGRLKDGQWTTMIDWTKSSTITPGKVNTLKVVANGDMFTLFINNKEVDSFVDDALPAGTAGMSVELYNTGDESVFEFDNFELKSP